MRWKHDNAGKEIERRHWTQAQYVKLRQRRKTRNIDLENSETTWFVQLERKRLRNTCEHGHYLFPPIVLKGNNGTGRREKPYLIHYRLQHHLESKTYTRIDSPQNNDKTKAKTRTYQEKDNASVGLYQSSRKWTAPAE